MPMDALSGSSPAGRTSSDAWIRLQPKEALTIISNVDGSKSARIDLPVRALNGEAGKGRDLLAQLQSATVGPPFASRETSVEVRRNGRHVSFDIPNFIYGGTGTAPMTLQLRLKSGQLVLLDVGSQRTRFDESRPRAARLNDNIAALQRAVDGQRSDIRELEAGLAQARGGFAPVPEWLDVFGWDSKFGSEPAPQDLQWPVAAVRDTIKKIEKAIAHDEKLIAKDTRELAALGTERGVRRASWAVKTPGSGWDPNK